MLIMSNSGYSYSSIRRLGSVVALIVKHQSVTDEGKQRSDLIAHVMNIASHSGHSLVIVTYFTPTLRLCKTFCC